MAETELKKGKHSMKTILEKVKKWLASVRFEIPAFCELCRTATRLLVKTVKKQDSAIEKSAIQELRTKTKNAQVAFGGILLTVLAICFLRGCGDSRKDALKLVAEMQAQEQKRIAEIERQQKAAEKAHAEEQAAKERAIVAIEASRKEELEKWRKRENAAFAKIDENLVIFSSQVLSVNSWPRLTLAGVTIGEPLPPNLSAFGAENEIKLEKPFLGFTSMRVHLQGPAAFVGKTGCQWHETKDMRIVESIYLYGDAKLRQGEIPMTIEKIEPTISKLLPSKPNFGNRTSEDFKKAFKGHGIDFDKEDRQRPLENVWWEGEPTWRAELKSQIDPNYHDPMTKPFFRLSLEVRGLGIYDNAKRAIDNKAIDMVNEHFSKFEEERKKIEEDHNQRRANVK